MTCSPLWRGTAYKQALSAAPPTRPTTTATTHALLLSFRESVYTLQALVEKASIDEVYIDVTSMVEAELQSLGGGAAGAAGAGGDAGATAGFGEPFWGHISTECHLYVQCGALLATLA